MTQDFPITRSILGRLDGWLAALLKPLLPLQTVTIEPWGFHWAFREETPQALMVGKAVRMISALHAAWLLTDLGFIAETGSLLRLVSDFADEILSVAEGVAKGRLTPPQEQFLKQYFTPFPTSRDEFERRRAAYVKREDLYKAHYRLGSTSDEDTAHLRGVSRYLKHGSDAFVHGAYLTAMELYDGRGSFMLSGHQSEEKRREYKGAVAGKLHEALTAMFFMATASNMDALAGEIGSAALTLHNSGKQQAA